MSVTTFPQVSGPLPMLKMVQNEVYAAKMKTPDQIMAEIDRSQETLDALPAGSAYRQILIGRIRTLEWVLSGGE